MTTWFSIFFLICVSCFFFSSSSSSLGFKNQSFFYPGYLGHAWHIIYISVVGWLKGNIYTLLVLMLYTNRWKRETGWFKPMSNNILLISSAPLLILTQQRLYFLLFPCFSFCLLLSHQILEGLGFERRWWGKELNRAIRHDSSLPGSKSRVCGCFGTVCILYCQLSYDWHW